MADPVGGTDVFAGLCREDPEAAIKSVGLLLYTITMDVDPDDVVNLISDNFQVVRLPFNDTKVRSMLRDEREKFQYAMWRAMFYEYPVARGTQAYNASEGLNYDTLKETQRFMVWRAYLLDHPHVIFRQLKGLSEVVEIDKFIVNWLCTPISSKSSLPPQGSVADCAHAEDSDDDNDDDDGGDYDNDGNDDGGDDGDDGMNVEDDEKEGEAEQSSSEEEEAQFTDADDDDRN